MKTLWIAAVLIASQARAAPMQGVLYSIRHGISAALPGRLLMFQNVRAPSGPKGCDRQVLGHMNATYGAGRLAK